MTTTDNPTPAPTTPDLAERRKLDRFTIADLVCEMRSWAALEHDSVGETGDVERYNVAKLRADKWGEKADALERLLTLATEAETNRARAEAAEARLAEADRIIAPFAKQGEGLQPRPDGSWHKDRGGQREIILEVSFTELTPFVDAASWRSTGGEG